MPHKFHPVNISRLDNPERRKTLPPREILALSGLKEGDYMIDIGAGTGFFSLPAAEMVGAAGRVFAVDSSAGMIVELNSRVRSAGAGNIEVIHSDEYNFKTGENRFDFGFMCAVLHEIDDKARFLGAVRGVLKPNGRLAIVEWVDKKTDMGPPPNDRVGSGEVKNLLSGLGFTNIACIDYGSSHYIVTADM
jgi:ubiquinone/menaquinone biosynthesis C-methylase UbiE